MRERFPRCDPSADFPWPWWPAEPEHDVRPRVGPFIDSLMSSKEDILLVGHGATTGAAYYRLVGRYAGGHYNACLSAIQLAPSFEILLTNDVTHLGEGQVTSNAQVIA